MWTRVWIFFCAVVWLGVARAAESKKAASADAFFRSPAIRTLHVAVPATSLAALRQGNREYVRATVKDGETVLQNVGLRLKGHGTFQPLDKKPAFTLKFNEFVSGQEFHGMSKALLNNSATDESFVRELLAGQLYRDAGVPAARGTHVRVLFNDRDLGFYVFVESMNKPFLKREFGQGGGNLYEGETRDVHEKLEQENGDDTTQRDLKALVAAASTPVQQRLQKMRSVLDVDQFTTFLALEMLTAGIDGYTFNRNNYRIYNDPKASRMVFLPHGLDATFGTAGFEPPTNSLVVRALWELPEFREGYRQRLASLAEKAWNADKLTNAATEMVNRLCDATTDSARKEQLKRELRTLCYQIQQQNMFLESEIKRRRNGKSGQ